MRLRCLRLMGRSRFGLGELEKEGERAASLGWRQGRGDKEGGGKCTVGA